MSSHSTKAVSMEFSANSILVSITALLLVLQILKSAYKATISSKSDHLPPEASGGWPIIGHLPLIGGSKLLHVTLGELADKFGPAFRIRLGLCPAFVVSNWQVAKELFTTNDISLSSRPKFLAAKHLGYDHAIFGFAQYGEYWREIRKLVSVQLLSARRLEIFKRVQVSEVETSIKELYKMWEQKRDHSNGRFSFEIKQWFDDISLNVIVKMVAGKRYVGTGNEAQDKEARKCQKAMRDFMLLFAAPVVGDVIPFLKWLDLGGIQKQMKKTALEIDEIAEGWLKEHRQKRKSKSWTEGDGEKDFMDVLLSMEEELGGFDVDTITKSTCMFIVAGGSDTPTVMLNWIIGLLLNNNKAMQEVQKEIDNQVGKERRVNESDIPHMPYLHAVVKETLRLYPASLLSFREFTESCNINGFHISKGTRLILNLWKLQRDPTIWEDPLEFKPERFLNTAHKDIDVKGQNFELIPFGAGRRICPAITFSLQYLPLVVANLLHAFDISTPSTTSDHTPALVDLTPSPGLTNMMATPLTLSIAPRLSPTLYP